MTPVLIAPLLPVPGASATGCSLLWLPSLSKEGWPSLWMDGVVIASCQGREP